MVRLPQTNNDRGRDYTIQGSATPVGQPSILGHQPHPALEPVGSQYGGVPQASAFGAMGHRLHHPGGWEVGASHMHGQMYAAFPGAMPMPPQAGQPPHFPFGRPY